VLGLKAEPTLESEWNVNDTDAELLNLSTVHLSG
jgi:hypothetical protein